MANETDALIAANRAFKNNAFSLSMWLSIWCARKLKEPRGVSECTLLQGKIFKVMGDYQLAAARMTAAKNKDVNFSHVNIELADVYLHTGDTEKSATLLQESEKLSEPSSEMLAKRDYLRAVLAEREKKYFRALTSATYAQWNDDLSLALRQPLRRLKLKVRTEEPYRLLAPFVLQYDTNPLWIQSLKDVPPNVTQKGVLRSLSGVVLESESIGNSNETGNATGYEVSLTAVNHLSGGYHFLDSYTLAAGYRIDSRVSRPMFGLTGFLGASPSLSLTFQDKRLSVIQIGSPLRFANIVLAPFLKYTPGGKVDSSGGFDFQLKDVEIVEDKKFVVASNTLLGFERTINSVFFSGQNYRLRQSIDGTYFVSQRLSIDSTLPVVTLYAMSWPRNENYWQIGTQAGVSYYLLPFLMVGLKASESLRFIKGSVISRAEIALSGNGVF